MCGIVGFTRPSHDADRLLAAMMDSIRYRGPDQDGIHIDDRIAVGHRRLSIIDLKGGKQPRVDSETGDVLVYNGEIYDYRRHAEDLRRDGVPLNDSSDTEVLFRLIQRHGVVAALERIEGMYAFAYRDGTSGRVTLARDRFGEKPLFYAVRERQLVFASEIKALRQHPALSAAGFDLAAIDQYLTFDYVPAPRTGYEDIRKLRPGHVAVFDGATVVETGYWQVPVSTGGHHPGSQPPTDLNAAVTTAEKILTDAIRSRLIADVPVGLFLSGGIDSALIAALASRIAPGITAYTIQLPGDGFDETPVAAEVANQFDLTHVVRRVTGTEVDAALDRLDDLIDEPFADPSIVPTFLLCETARQGVKVAVGGDGADELFAGYINFQARRFASLMARLSPKTSSALRGIFGTLPASDRYMSLPFRLAQLSQGFGQPVDRQSFLWMAPFDSAARDRLTSFPARPESVFEPVDDWLDRRYPPDPVDRLQYLFSTLYLPDDILTKVDRASMYNSLEVRAPFLSTALADFAFSIPPQWRVNGFETKFLLRKLAARHLPKSVASRKKHGFALPVASLLRSTLRERIGDTLLDPANPMAPYFKPDAIVRLIDDHMAERRDHRKQLWSLYALFRFAAGSKVTAVERPAAVAHG